MLLAAWCLASCEQRPATVPESRTTSRAQERTPALQPDSKSSRKLAQDADAALPTRAPKVVFLGDSITAGLHLSDDEAYPALLAQRLSAAGHSFEPANAGVSGDTSAGGLRRVDWVLKQAPEVVVVELGGNDGLRGMPVAEIEQNLRRILRKILARGARPILLGMVLPPSEGEEYTREFAALYPRLAGELQVAFVPYFMQGVAGVANLNLEDGLHPNVEGQRKLADTIEPVLRETLEALPKAQRSP